MSTHSSKIDRVCATCGKPFQAWPHEVAAGQGRFCSRECFHAGITVPLEVTFWKHVGPPTKVSTTIDTPCRLWLGKKDRKGYGRTTVLIEKGKRKEVFAHRVAYELSTGPIPEGAGVLHRCDVPRCCEPAHLFLGTNTDNVADMVAKNRQAMGEGSGANRLTETDVRTIISLYNSGKGTMAELAEVYRVSIPSISMIVNRITWRHLEIETTTPSPKRKKSVRLTDNQIREVRALHTADGVSMSKLAEMYQVTVATISLIISRKTRADVE